MKKTISERIKEALEIRGMKQSELVEKTGIGKSSISTYIAGSYEPKQRNIYRIAEALNVNEAWLMGLDVDMDRLNTMNKLEVTKQEAELLANYNKLNDLGKKEANKRVSELAEMARYTFAEPLTVAAHDDDLTPEEKDLAFNKALDVIKKNRK